MSRSISNRCIGLSTLGYLVDISDSYHPKLRGGSKFIKSWILRYRPHLGSGVRPLDAEGLTVKRRYNKCRSKRKTVQQKLWNTMKISRRFTLTDLMITANTNRNTAWHYTNQLVLAGYVRLAVRVNPRLSVQDKYGLTNIYQLIRDTGRFSPMKRENGCWDQNQQRLYPFQFEEGEHGHVA